jgi:hypothetical protein
MQHTDSIYKTTVADDDDDIFYTSQTTFLSLQAMGKGAKKAIAGDEWRNRSVEERLEYSLVKVRTHIVVFLHRVWPSKRQFRIASSTLAHKNNIHTSWKPNG